MLDLPIKKKLKSENGVNKKALVKNLESRLIELKYLKKYADYVTICEGLSRLPKPDNLHYNLNKNPKIFLPLLKESLVRSCTTPLGKCTQLLKEILVFVQSTGSCMFDLEFKQEYNRRLANLEELSYDFICLDIFPGCNSTWSVQKTISSGVVVLQDHSSKCKKCLSKAYGLSKVDRAKRQNYFTVFKTSSKTIERIESIRKETFDLRQPVVEDAFKMLMENLPRF